MTGYLCVADISAPGEQPRIALAIFRDRSQAARWSQGGELGVVEVNADKYIHRFSGEFVTFGQKDQSTGELKRLLSESGIDPTSGEYELPAGFSARLQSLRESKNMTREELADAIGSSRQRIHQLETGSHKPRWEEVQAIADVLGTPTDTFRDS